MTAVLEKIGAAIYIGHSAAGTRGGRIANERPELFKAMIGIEPAGACNLPPTAPLKGMTKAPSFSIHGINQVGRPDTGPCIDTYAKINAAGGDASYLSLPKLPSSPLLLIMQQAFPQRVIVMMPSLKWPLPPLRS